MKIPTFKQFINEGFLSKTLNRAKTGEVRIENKTPIDDYLKDVRWEDLGHPDVLFALNDYGYNGFRKEPTKLSVNEIRQVITNLPNDISIMNEDIVDWLKNNTTMLRMQDDFVGLISKVKKTQTRFIYTEGFSGTNNGGYLIELGDYDQEKYCNYVNEMKFQFGHKGKTQTFCRTNIVDEDKFDQPLYHIKLVRKK